VILKGGAGGEISGLIHASRVTATDDVLANAIGASAGATASRKWWPIPAAHTDAIARPRTNAPWPSGMCEIGRGEQRPPNEHKECLMTDGSRP
jgi:hypothetical protein